jgi:hypothetical protein
MVKILYHVNFSKSLRNAFFHAAATISVSLLQREKRGIISLQVGFLAEIDGVTTLAQKVILQEWGGGP